MFFMCILYRLYTRNIIFVFQINYTLNIIVNYSNHVQNIFVIYASYARLLGIRKTKNT